MPTMNNIVEIILALEALNTPEKQACTSFAGRNGVIKHTFYCSGYSYLYRIVNCRNCMLGSNSRIRSMYAK